MMKAPLRVGIALCLMALSGCASMRSHVDEVHATWEQTPPPDDAALVYRAFLVGDTGAPLVEGPDPFLGLLQTHLSAAGQDAAVIFLGDNLYCCGLPDSANTRRALAERRILTQLQTIKDFEGRIVFIPGNHDWNNAKAGGLEALNREEAFIEAYLDRGNVFLPDDGFPGPVEVDLTDQITLVALDTQWWLYKHLKPFGDTEDYELDEEGDFLFQLDDVLKRNDDKDVLVVGHHPMFTQGAHGGYLPLRDHIFPLANLIDNAYLPLPLIGSLYPLYIRYFGGGRQDLKNPRYTDLRRTLVNTFYTHESLIYASGHEHNLQYFTRSAPPPLPGHTQHYIVSGSASKPEPVAPGRDAHFVSGRQGFALLNYYDDGSIWMEMWATTEADTNGELLFRTQIKEPSSDAPPPPVALDPDADLPDYSDSTRVLAANTDYLAGGVKSFFLGSHNRAAWATPVEARVLDLGTEKGGLTPVKRGGGQQTISLRLRNPEGKEYVLRSIDKDPSKTVPVNLQGTVATDIVQDQIASIHPYGAFIIPPLAEAAGVYHTNPELVYVPHDPRLGLYQETFAGQLMMLEDRPDDDESAQPSFGRSEDVVSAHRLYRQLNDDNDHRVDQHAFLRVRLFDLLLSDWDRHRDQWRWASFEPFELDPTLEGDARKEGKIYRPIPRDRDWAFNRMNGLFPSLAGYFDPKFQDFKESYGNIRGLVLNALEQDRRLLNQLTLTDFTSMAEELRAALTDTVIEDAVRAWPEAIYALDGERAIGILKARRDALPIVAEEFYHIHARVVDVVGSNKHERFEVTRFEDDSTLVVVHKINKKGQPQREIYRRTFSREDTKEIRLYGLSGEDQFMITGEAKKGILVRAIGGQGVDTFTDRSRVRGLSKLSHFYDSASEDVWEIGPETKRTRSDDPVVNAYNPYAYQYNATLPTTFFGSNKDDGLFLGGGLHFIRHGFRKAPYATSHVIKANLATKTLAFNIVYEGHFVEAFGAMDFYLDAEYLSPDNIRNFYGLGNETENTEDNRRFYQAQMTQVTLKSALFKLLEDGTTFRIGPTLEITNVDQDDDRFITRPQAGISDGSFENQTFTGIEAELVLNSVDKGHNPRQGLVWTNLADLNVGILNADDTYTTLSTDVALYLSPSLSPQVTLALRAGSAHNIGDFPFYGANTLGGTTNLRGHRSTRYAGRTSFYQNAELRLQLFEISTYFAIGKVGLLGFVDNGRVWTDGERSRVWHQGYGGGLWIDLFDLFALNTSLGFSDDDTTFSFGFGFQY